MAKQVHIQINGQAVTVAEGTSVAAALARAGEIAWHRSPRGQLRGPVCGMGICGECRVSIDGEPHQRSCLIHCRDGMEVVTDA